MTPSTQLAPDQPENLSLQDQARELIRKINLIIDQAHESLDGTFPVNTLDAFINEISPFIQLIASDPEPWPEPFSIDNPSPEFTLLRETARQMNTLLIDEDHVIVIDETIRPDPDPALPEPVIDPVFHAIGVMYVSGPNGFNDDAYAASKEDALTLYLAKMKERIKQFAVQEFIRADKDRKVANDIYARYDACVGILASYFEPGDHFQDTEGTVYQLATQEWVKVKVKPIIVNRTRREGERNGDLSLTAARDLGYIVEGEGKKEPKEKKASKASIIADEFNAADGPSKAGIN